MMSGMVKGKYTYRIIEGVPVKEDIETLLALYTKVFEDAKPDFFIERIKTKQHILSIIAFENSIPVGFKIGYTYNKVTYYSWIGGVVQLSRKNGIATRMLEIQEQWVVRNGYSILRTKSMNRFKPMLLLNIKNGFDIVNVYTNTKNQTKIIFEKKLRKVNF